MQNQPSISRNTIVKKDDILSRIKSQLKKEFIGLDQLIDELIESVGFWYLFPDLQEKPLVINLWGMTGVGKTSLVKRMVSLLEMEKSFILFDLGTRNNFGCSVEAVLWDVYEKKNGKPLILGFDEFHNARTLDNGGVDNFASHGRIVWQILDSGKYQIHPKPNYLQQLHDVIHKLEHFLRSGVEVKNGLVTSKVDYFLRNIYYEKSFSIFNRNKSNKDKEVGGILFVGESIYPIIMELARDEFISTKALQDKLMQMDGYEIVEYLKKIYEDGASPKWVDCSKSLILIMGNLDEAYQMTGNFNPDIQADHLHQQTLKVDVFQIKKALRRRFRSEHISRLGNIHFLFPAFSSKSFERLIDQELMRISQLISSRFGIDLVFENTVPDMIYEEGVFPTQGTRPVYSSIQQHIISKLGRIISEGVIKDLVVDKIFMGVQEDKLFIKYLRANEIEHQIEMQLTLNLKKLKDCKQDDLQAITAVHESGHAVLSIVLLNSLPEMVISSTPDQDIHGFVHSSVNWKYVSKKEIIRRIAMMLGGMAAEKWVFGEENLTSGSANDLMLATEFATDMIKSSGLGSRLGSFNSKAPQTFNYLYDHADQLTEEAENLILEAFRLAEDTLKEHEQLLLKMAEFLSIERSLSKDKCLEFVRDYGSENYSALLSKDGDSDLYRGLLRKKLKHSFGNKKVSSNGIHKRQRAKAFLN
ncbi:MAG: hypothetical protein EA362_11190 [Saprospirales bacterium]|nr:MAG: hypothetical protein EA362_11190 [Saprospirales bacterium]